MESCAVSANEKPFTPAHQNGVFMDKEKKRPSKSQKKKEKYNEHRQQRQ